MFVDACITISDLMELILCYDPMRCYHFRYNPARRDHLYVRSVHKAHTNMNANRGAGFLYLFIKQNTSTEIKLLMLLFVDY